MNNLNGRVKKLESLIIPPPPPPPVRSAQERRLEVLKVLRPIIERTEDPESRRQLRADLRSDLDEVTKEEAEEFINLVYHAVQLSKHHQGEGGNV
jgi:ribosome recycling factor